MFAVTFLVLVGAWEGVLRARAGAAVDFTIARPQTAPSDEAGEEWLLLGNCLVMTGVSPKALDEQLGAGGARRILNIATHEQSPLAYFTYLQRTGRYPRVVVANVSSWLNGTNFEQEAAHVAAADPLGLGTAPAAAPERGVASGEQVYRTGGEAVGRVQTHVEDVLSREAAAHLRAFGKRYHLFDYALFLGVLATTASLDQALYQLNVQSWFRVRGSETDGQGFVGIDVDYADDWPSGVERMAERSLQRLRLSRMLTPRYWELLEEGVRDLRAHGTRVVLVRLPEHPKIRAFNEERYEISSRVRQVASDTGAEALDLSALGPEEGVRLFDGVHPDASGAGVITRAIGASLREEHAAPMGEVRDRASGGGS